ncbi:TetR/AcrR family transcriptional regulator [Rhodobacteraceae bacterium]|nr:TetR/AcrR family transcriptional regulator [Paracoccaceae bacterium]
MAKVSKTRALILDIAQDATLTKGFGATSIEEIVAAAEISKGGFFYHFPDKNALALALIERYIDDDSAIFEGLFARARVLSDDPLQRALITLELFAEVLDDIPKGHPGCLVASFVYQERQFDKRVHEASRTGVLAWRQRFREAFDEIVKVYEPNEDVDLNALADMVIGTVEGGIILAKAFGDASLTSQQVRLLRSYVKLQFTKRRE